jgi:hypothetical protein
LQRRCLCRRRKAGSLPPTLRFASGTGLATVL